MSRRPVSYDPASVAIIIAGHQITGYADGSFVQWSAESQDWQTYSGADGHFARAKTNDRRGTLSLSLAQTSSSNHVLSDLRKRDMQTNDGVFSVTVKERGVSAPILLHSPGAFILQPPNVDRSKEIGEYDWQIYGTWQFEIGESELIDILRNI